MRLSINVLDTYAGFGGGNGESRGEPRKTSQDDWEGFHVEQREERSDRWSLISVENPHINRMSGQICHMHAPWSELRGRWKLDGRWITIPGFSW